MKRLKTLVSGASGFVGSRLARLLADEGHSVSVIVRPNSDLSQLAPVLNRITVHRVDSEPGALSGIMAAEHPDVVFHLATHFVFDHKPEDVEALVASNVLFPVQLADAMARNGVRFLVNTGSAWQHFRDADYDPVCLHAATKQAFEDLLAYFVSAGKIECITLKLNDTYGPGDPRRKIFTLLRESALNRSSLKMSAGEQLIDIVHIDDVTAAFVAAAERLVEGAVAGRHEDYVVSSGRPLSLRKLVELYLQLSGTQLAVEWGARSYRDREVMVPWRKGKPVPGWSPRIPLEAGLKQLSQHV
jgi:nucleoside-diphosphate-sugar epimerase